jgi:mRNA interferase MazF
MSPFKPMRGEVWMLDLGVPKGHEQGNRRPGLVLSMDTFNYGPADLVVIAPLTTKDKRINLHVPVSPPEGGVTENSFVKCEDIRSISKGRLIRRMGVVTESTMDEVIERVKILLGICP